MTETYYDQSQQEEDARNATPVRERGGRWNPEGRAVRSNAPQVESRHTEAEEAELRSHYESLLPQANIEYVNYFLARTPAHMQEDMKDLIQEGLVAEAQTMVKNNFGAPPSQVVDVDAVAQAAAKSIGTARADEVREAGMEVGTPNATNTRFPLVNVRPGETGPIVTGGGDATAKPGQLPPGQRDAGQSDAGKPDGGLVDKEAVEQSRQSSGATAKTVADQKERAYQRNKALNQQGNEGQYDASTSTLRPHPEQQSDTPAVAPSDRLADGGYDQSVSMTNPEEEQAEREREAERRRREEQGRQ